MKELKRNPTTTPGIKGGKHHDSQSVNGSWSDIHYNAQKTTPKSSLDGNLYDISSVLGQWLLITKTRRVPSFTVRPSTMAFKLAGGLNRGKSVT